MIDNSVYNAIHIHFFLSLTYYSLWTKYWQPCPIDWPAFSSSICWYKNLRSFLACSVWYSKTHNTHQNLTHIVQNLKTPKNIGLVHLVFHLEPFDLVNVWSTPNFRNKFDNHTNLVSLQARVCFADDSNEALI